MAVGVPLCPQGSPSLPKLIPEQPLLYLVPGRKELRRNMVLWPRTSNGESALKRHLEKEIDINESERIVTPSISMSN